MGDYVCFVHPSVERDIRTMVAKDKWQHEYRNWRRSLKPAATPQQILAGQYRPRWTPLHEYAGASECGFFERVRFITSPPAGNWNC